jgi:hypothetical protein
MAEIESVPAKRARFQFEDENFYLTITDDSVIAHFPAEGSYKNKDIKALLNFCCRLMSKLRDGKPMTWEQIAERATRSGVGFNSIVDELARVIRECQK